MEEKHFALYPEIPVVESLIICHPVPTQFVSQFPFYSDLACDFCCLTVTVTLTCSSYKVFGSLQKVIPSVSSCDKAQSVFLLKVGTDDTKCPIKFKRIQTLTSFM